MGRRTSALVTIPQFEHQKNVRFLHFTIAALTISACTATSFAVARPVSAATVPSTATCAAWDAASHIDWRISDEAETRELSRWCRAVGAPVMSTVSPAE